MNENVDKTLRIRELTKSPELNVSDGVLSFLAFYRLFPPASSDENFLSFQVSDTSENSFLDGSRVTTHDISDHVGSGRHNYDTVDSHAIIPNVEGQFDYNVECISNWVGENVMLFKKFIESSTNDTFQTYFYKSIDKNKIPGDGIRRYLDEMEDKEWQEMFRNMMAYHEATDLINNENYRINQQADKTHEDLRLIIELKQLSEKNSNLIDYKIRSLMLETKPRVIRKQVFQHFLKINMYAWVESWIDALLKGENKVPAISDEILNENDALNQLFKESPDYFDMTEGTEEHAKELKRQEILTRKVQYKVKLLINKVAHFESQRVLLLEKLKEWEIKNGYSSLHDSNHTDHNDWTRITSDQFPPMSPSRNH